jgi:hypothetical protein
MRVCRAPRSLAGIAIAMVVLALPGFAGSNEKLSPRERLDIVRGLASEFATAKILMPRSKKPLPFSIDGVKKEDAWTKAMEEFGPAARKGDVIQITKIDIQKDEIIFEINNGMKSGRKWYDRIQVGVGSSNSTAPIGGNRQVTAPGGTEISLKFPGPIPSVPVEDIKKYLSPLFDFDKRSASEQYVESLPPEIKKAIEEKKPVEGMDREQVLMSMGHPRQKIRETRDGIDYEDWVYGNPPGKITFITFKGSKVSKVVDSYAGIGGSTAPNLPPPE